MTPTNIAVLAVVLDLLFGHELRNEVFRSLGIVWRSGNRWGRQWLTLPVLGWLLGLYALAANQVSVSARMHIWLLPMILLAVCLAWWPVLLGGIIGVYKKNLGARDSIIGTMHLAGWVLFTGLAFAVTPVWMDPVMVTFVMGLILFLYLWNAGQTAFWRTFIKKWGTRAAIAAIFILVAALFLGGREKIGEYSGWIGRRAGHAAEATAAAVSDFIPRGDAAPPTRYAKVIRVPLQGEGKLSEMAVNLNTIVPGGTRCEFEGPSTAKVHFDDGTEGLLSDEFGVKGGRIRFSGPAGTTVTIKFYPPR